MSHDDRAETMGDALTTALVRELAHEFRLHDPDTRVVIGIAGESGSGKSTTATHLAMALTAKGIPTVVINQDNYFIRPPLTNHAFRVVDLSAVGPHEVNLGLIEAHMAAFRRGEPSVNAPLVNYPENRFDEQRLDLQGRRVLIVEGTYVLHLPTLDSRIFLEATHAETHERRMARARDLHEPIIDTILAIEHEIISQQAGLADLLIDRDFQLRRRVHER
jgi:uridine kinase